MMMNVMRSVDYDQRQHTVYARGRELTTSTLSSWMRTFAAHCPSRRPLTVLDLGCGIGRFTPALADTFVGPVYGVEPSRRMRQIAEHSARHSAVTYLDGSARHIPLPHRSCEVVLLFLVWHHVPDQPQAAAEIARVLCPDGRVLIRSVFSDRMPTLTWQHYFPRAAEIEQQMFPALADVLTVFGEVGFEQWALQAVPVRLANSLAEHAQRLRLRAISTFEHLTEEETTQGFTALDGAVTQEKEPRPVETTSDLLVLNHPRHQPATHRH
jgi:ubiquinone/menaquinone biosynthesis C-methylase UbiE